MLNWAILKEPVNWFTIWTMFAVGGLLIWTLQQHPALTDFASLLQPDNNT